MTITEGKWYLRADRKHVRVKHLDSLYFRAGGHVYQTELNGKYWSGGPSHLDLLSECPDPSSTNRKNRHVRST